MFVFALVIWSLTSHLFPRTYPGLDVSTYLVMGFIAAALFFASILLHELGHAFQALKEGMHIDGITLWLFGGVARFTGLFPSPGAEFRIAIAGPAVSVVLALGFWLVSFAAARAGLPEPVQGVASYLARINAIVTGFNLVPALPLDGGRILRAWLWQRRESFGAATHSAAAAGKAFGGVLVALGLLDFLTGGGGGGGLWFVFLGWFLIQAAQGEAASVYVYQLLRGRKVREFMTATPVTVTSDTNVDEFLDDVIGERGHSTYPVVDRGELVGVVSLRRAGAVPPSERSHKTVSDVMWHRDRVTALTPQADMADALPSLQEDPRRIPVVEDGRVVGILSISDVAHALELERARGPRPGVGKPARVLVWVVVATAIVIAAGFIYHPPVVVLQPGETVDVLEDITIEGTSTSSPSGKYLLTSVRLDRPTALETIYSAVTNEDVLPLSAVLPPGVDADEYLRQQREVFRQSRMVAAAAAARATGMKVLVRGSGAIVEDVVPASPAAEELAAGDVIVGVDDEPIDVATDLQQLIRAHPAGTRFALTVERDGQRERVRLSSAPLSEVAEGAVGIGVVVSTRDLQVDLPFEVRFEERRIGGPSAGLTYALAIVDMLNLSDLSRGDVIAATGTIDVGGDVGPVGGVDAKSAAVQEAGADLFFVPQQEVDHVDAEGVEVRGVSDLGDALEVLEERPARP